MADPDLTPGQEHVVRRLLAEARHDEPMPDDVVERLDRVLTGLAEGHAPAPVAEVPALAVRRRRAAALLLAAAAVVAVGVGLGQVLGPDLEDRAASDSAAAPRETGGPAEDPPDDEAGATAAESPVTEGLSALPQAYSVVVPPPRIRSASFAEDVRATRRAARAPRSTATDLSGLGTGSPVRKWSACDPAGWGPGRLIPVTYDGVRAVLVLRRRTGETQVADLFACGGGDVLRSVTLPAR